MSGSDTAKAGALAGAAGFQSERVAKQLDRPNTSTRLATQVVHRRAPAQASELSVYRGQEHVATILIRGQEFKVIIGGQSIGVFSNQKGAVAAAIAFVAGRVA